MTKTLDRIEDDVFEASNDGQMPYITLQAFRLGIEAARQLTRIADALEKPEHPTLPSLTRNSLSDGLDEYRYQHTDAIDEALGEAASIAPVEWHKGECLYPDEGACDGCQFVGNCVHTA